jgi:ABC-type cobalamin transport system permease subunit
MALRRRIAVLVVGALLSVAGAGVAAAVSADAAEADSEGTR